MVSLIKYILTGFTENLLYDSCSHQQQPFDYNNYALIDESATSPPPRPSKKGSGNARSGPGKCPITVDTPADDDCPEEALYTLPIKKSDGKKDSQETGRNAKMNLQEEEDATANPLYDLGKA